jgi:2-dehydro-3-deoxyglucarate aldolase/4-hydroxy-2-oxoheptanedioate aldolase
MRPNPVKERLASGGVAFGVFFFEVSTLGSPRIADAAGAEFAFWDMEHTGWTTETIRSVMAAARLSSAWPMVRVPRAEHHLIATALDAGAMGVMVPMVESGEQARLVVEAVKYPPLGRRGFGAIYPDQTPEGPGGWMEASNRETLVFCQLETVAGVEQADAIVGTEGVDVAWVGHFDLTASLGIPGRFDHPRYAEAIDALLAVCGRHGKPLGIMVTTAEQGKAALERGFRVIAFGDLWVLVDALRRGLGELRAAGS